MLHNSMKHFPETLQISYSSCNKSRIFFPYQNAVHIKISGVVIAFSHLTNIHSYGIGGFAPISVIPINK